MFENWLIIAFVAPALWALVNLIDVYFVNDVYRDEYDGTIISGLFPLLPWVLVPFGMVVFDFPEHQWWLFLISGMLFLFANFFYFKSLFSNNDAALVQIFWNLTVPLTIMISWIFLKESLELRQYVGMGIVIVGVIYLSLQKKSGKWKPKEVLKNMVPAAVFLALSLVLAEYAYRESSAGFFDGYLVFALGMVTGALIISLVSKGGFHDRFAQVAKLTGKYFVVFFFAELLALVGTIASQRAVDLSPSASLVATIESLSPVFVMAFSILIIFFGRFLMKEKFTQEHDALYSGQTLGLLQKIIATATIAVGILLMS
ncbi:MAG: EamA family transporter [Candidatus Moraniibacteriota bacterium]